MCLQNYKWSSLSYRTHENNRLALVLLPEGAQGPVQLHNSGSLAWWALLYGIPGNGEKIFSHTLLVIISL